MAAAPPNDHTPIPVDKRRPSVASQTYFKFGEITDKYMIGEVIGTGNYAEVRLGTNRVTGDKVAIKILPLKSEATQDILNEIDILARVDDHPHVIQLKEIYEKKGRMYIVMELVTGGELFDRIINRQHFSETDARDIMHVLFETVGHMHSYGIVHRDLKPENILFASPDPDSPIKIADFGLAKLWQPEDDDHELKTLCGTPGYVAPEVLKNRKGYTAQCDMWSLGVVLYIMLCGYPPFQHEQQAKLFKQILKADFHFHSPWWDNVSDEAKDLVCKLLVVDPTKRLSPKEAMQHPWMKRTHHGGSVDIDKLDEYVKRINKRKFRMIKNAIIAAHRLGELGLKEMAPPSSSSMPPPRQPDTNNNNNNNNNNSNTDNINTVDCTLGGDGDGSGEFEPQVFSADWVKARQESIVRRSSRAEELKKKKFSTHAISEED